MVDIKKTSDMMYPLEEPNGWFLRAMHHEHERTGQSHYTPVQNGSGAWHVEFRRIVSSQNKTNAAFGRGHSMEQAWAKAKAIAESAGE